MKKFIKRLIKEAVLEALKEWALLTFATPRVLDNPNNNNGSGNGTGTGTGNGTLPDEDLNSGTTPEGGETPGEGSAESGGGGITDDGRPRPDVGVGVFSKK